MRDWSSLPGILSAENWIASLPDSVRHEILSRMVAMDLSSGQVLTEVGADPAGFFQLESGFLRLVTLHRDGRQTLLAIYRPGNCLGESPLVAHRPSNHTTIAMTDARVRMLPLESFWTLYHRHSEIPEALCRKFANTMSRLVAAREITATNRLRKLLAFAFCNLAEMCGRREPDGSITIDLPLTQYDLADHFGVTRQAVQREVGALKQLGMIAKRDALWRVLDAAGLERLGHSPA